MNLCIFAEKYYMQVYIYSLTDPTTKEIRYIGKTNSITRRLQSHINYAKSTKRKRRHVSDWILSLLNQGLKPIIKIVEEIDNEIWVEREMYWIKYFRLLHNNLCNLTDGGEGNTGYVYSEELKNIRRLARLGKACPEEVKKKISKTLGHKIICVDDNIIFDSIKDAIAYSNIPKTTFHRKLYNNNLINGKKYEIY